MYRARSRLLQIFNTIEGSRVSIQFSKCLHNECQDKVEVKKLKEERVFLIGINRPDVRNAVDPPTARLLYQAFKTFESDDTSNVAVLYGKGGTFCAGYDLKAFAANDDISSLSSDPLSSDIGPMGPSRLSVTKPVIGAVSGFAVAGGLELALMCDLRVVEDSAIMGVYCRRFGVPLLDGGTVRLPRLIGLSRALDLILTGRAVNAREALEYGLANRVVPTGSALDEAIKLATEIGRFPQKCMNADRESAYHGVYDSKSMTEALQYEFVNGVKVIQEESLPGAKSFTQGTGKHGKFNN